MNAAALQRPELELVGRRAVLATKHGKERAIGPILRKRLGMFLEVLQLDTDLFGTFTGEVPRQGSQRDALYAKLAAAAAETPYDAVFVASEGAFFPDPLNPFVTVNRELVGLYDRVTERYIVGSAVNVATGAMSSAVSNERELESALRLAQFPSHGVIVRAGHAVIGRGLTQRERVVEAVTRAWKVERNAIVESDPRARWNPSRMRTIAAACNNLVERVRSCCPSCSAPDFWFNEAGRGLPCAACGSPTDVPLHSYARCSRCSFSSQRDICGPGNPASCPHCNP